MRDFAFPLMLADVASLICCAGAQFSVLAISQFVRGRPLTIPQLLLGARAPIFPNIPNFPTVRPLVAAVLAAAHGRYPLLRGLATGMSDGAGRAPAGGAYASQVGLHQVRALDASAPQGTSPSSPFQ